MQQPTPLLMFIGQAEEAMNFYISVFPNTTITDIARYPEGSVMKASFTINGQEFSCIDSPIKHDFTFTPSISFYIFCDTEEEIDRLFAALSANGKIFMPLTPYPFSKKFGWVEDRFGVSWQLSLKP
jgi:predicted 3-demethylubiquinone-9 3-methyltransferase (glyoxalase superfamily)